MKNDLTACLIKLTFLLAFTHGCLAKHVLSSPWGSLKNVTVRNDGNTPGRAVASSWWVHSGNCVIGGLYTVPQVPAEPPDEYSLPYTYTGELYGLSIEFTSWPLTTTEAALHPHVTTIQQPIAERYWLTSTGEYYFFEAEAPLFVTYNRAKPNSLDFHAKVENPFVHPAVYLFEITNCKCENAKIAHTRALQSHLSHPKDMPDETIIRNPLLSTININDIDETQTLQLVDNFLNNGFKGGQIDIEESWESCEGNLDINTSRFPNMKSLSSNLNDKGFQISLSVHPFIGTECSVFEQADSYIVKSQNENYLARRRGDVGIIDVTNPRAADWWEKRLRSFMDKNGIDSLKFVAGESDWLPKNPTLTGSANLFPNLYSQKYVEFAAKFGKKGQVGVGFQSGEFPIFVRMMEKSSSWEGLSTLIPNLLQMNIAGYPFVLPATVGGVGEKPSKELFIRWLQATVFMPVIKFSYLPSDFDDETIKISKKFTELHSRYADQIIKVMRKAISEEAPVNPPIWWISPFDNKTFSINDEYLLGESLLVAPVLKEGARKRDIYLPEGEWQDKLRNEIINGPKLITNYKVALNELPYFVKSGASSMRAVFRIWIIILIRKVLF